MAEGRRRTDGESAATQSDEAPPLAARTLNLEPACCTVPSPSGSGDTRPGLSHPGNPRALSGRESATYTAAGRFRKQRAKGKTKHERLYRMAFHRK